MLHPRYKIKSLLLLSLLRWPQRSRWPTAALARSSERQASGVSPSTEASIRRPGALSPFAPSWSRPRGPLRSAPQIEWRETSAAAALPRPRPQRRPPATSHAAALLRPRPRLRSPGLTHDDLARGGARPASHAAALARPCTRRRSPGLAHGGPPCSSARHGMTKPPVVPCLGRDLGMAALRGTARQCRRAPPCRAPPCPCRVVRPVWPTIPGARARRKHTSDIDKSQPFDIYVRILLVW